MKLILTTILFVSTYFFAQAQDTIYLGNPSFEGVPVEGGSPNQRLPKNWHDCGFPRESPPDVHPVHNGQFQVFKQANHGDTYIGMVTRDNDTWERIGGKLTSSFEKESCYEFSIALARSEIYLSYSQLLNERYDSTIQANYVEPIVLRIYGGNTPCERTEMIGLTGLVRNTKWLTFNFQIQPAEDYKYITFEAFYITPTLVPYNGNILLDNVSPFVKIPCENVEGNLAKTLGFKNKEEIASYEKGIGALKIKQDSLFFAKQEAKYWVKSDFKDLLTHAKLMGKSIKFKAESADFDPAFMPIDDEDYTSESGLNKLLELVKTNPNLSLLIGVKNKNELQEKRMEKLTETVRAAGLTSDFVLIRKYKKVKKLYKWDTKNDDLVFYVFEPED